ncbi:MAG: hypothetical protein U0640_12875 [Phycisphaerales bacterium]
MAGVFYHAEVETDLGSYKAVAAVEAKIERVQNEVAELMLPTPWDYFARSLKLKVFGLPAYKLWQTDVLASKRIVLWIESFDGPVYILHAWKPDRSEKTELLALARSLMHKEELQRKAKGKRT